MASTLSSQSQNSKKVTYIFDEDLAKETSRITSIGNRSFMVHELIQAYQLTSFMECRPSKLAKMEDLLSFHSQDYVDYLCSEKYTRNESENAAKNSLTDDSEDLNEVRNDSTEFRDQEDDEYGLGYDCPPFSSMDRFALRITGSTLVAAESLLNGSDISINWCGGWHHAQRDAASGFCYVNDIVIGIQALQKKFKKILYIDIDAHHGDGVDNAFSCSKNITTLSFHNYEPGFFPGSGHYNDFGFGKGKYHSVNVPLKSGIIDRQFIFIFDSILNSVEEKFKADAIVLQCGMDGLSKDPLGTFNLTLNSYGHCVKEILKRNIPTLFLGGGGYNSANSARGWTYLTSIILSQSIPSEIPEHKYFLSYGSDFELEISESLRKNENGDAYIQEIISKIQGNLDQIKCV